MVKVFITGACGFIGSHLVEYLTTLHNIEIYGTKHNPQVTLSEYEDKIKLFECDVKDKNKLSELLKEINPDIIFHLAAQSYPTVSWEEPVRTIEDNVIGTINLFEIIKELNLNPIIFVACSSAEYGYISPDNVPVKEEQALLPLHPYGLSKVAQENLAYQYYKNFGLKTVSGRIFNTTGPRKIRDVISEFSQQIAKIEAGKQEPVMKIGNLDTRRDITDVRDMVRAIWMLTQKAKYGDVYNLSSNHAISIEYILDNLLTLTKKEIKIEVSPSKLRTTDEPIIQGANEKFVEATGWKPEIPFEQTLKDSLDYWRRKHGVSIE